MELKEDIKSFLKGKGVNQPSEEVVDHLHEFLKKQIDESSERLANVLRELFGDQESK
ncbi:hypothetical protein [Brevibacillus sp. NRS-1366]|uniref:hypothetical protein n=1 Tax=Brevibacillus sp. NRS-1366 TaxID=3233899 RepID=UPI003D199704